MKKDNEKQNLVEKEVKSTKDGTGEPDPSASVAPQPPLPGTRVP